MKDPAFLFYPGDYLRDTQCLSEAVQVAYDRIMCEHMRNICISQQQLNFFTKRLTDDQKSELAQVLTQIPGGFQISWVAESIEKRRNYSESRRNNRKGSKKHMSNISKTYDSHMENENENRNVIVNTDKGGLGEKTIIGEVISQWQQSGLTVETSEAKDIRELCEKILNIKDIAQADELKRHELLGVMEKIISWVKSENNIKYYGSLKSINNNFSKIINSLKNGNKQTKRTGEGSSPDELAEVVRRRFSNQPQV